MTTLERAKNLVVRINEVSDSPSEFCKKFKGRGPSINTIKRVIDFANEKTATPPSQSTIAKIEACLDTPRWKYRAFESIKEMAFLNEQGIANASRYVGNYKYYRYNSAGNIVDGGLILEHKAGISCFYHFNDAERMETFTPKDCNESDLEKLHNKVSHVGFYYLEGDRVCFIAIGQTYFRALIGIQVSDLSTNYLRVGVLTRDKSGAAFAARSVAIHHSNSRYNSTPSEETIRNALDKQSEKGSFFTVYPSD